MLIDNETSEFEETTPQDENEITNLEEEAKEEQKGTETVETTVETSELDDPVIEEKEESPSHQEKEDEKVEVPLEEDKVEISQPEAPESDSQNAKEIATEDSTSEPSVEPADTPSDPVVVPIVLTEEQDVILKKIQEITESEDDIVKLIDASPENLISLIGYFSQGEVRAHVGHVAILKNSFDAIRAKGDVSDELTESFREKLAGFHKLRAESKKQIENKKISNAEKKRNLLVKLKEIVDSGDVYRIDEVREVQDSWKQIGHVPKKDLDEMYREYRSLLDNFYQKREMHFELLEYDRKINLQEKEKLIKEANKLIPAEDQRDDVEVWKQKMDMFHELQQQWRSIGHVPREDMERIRDEFRNVVDQFFEARQEYVDIIDKHREENAEKKEALLVKMKEFASFEAKKPKEWNEATQSFRALQEEWKMLGPAPKSVNNELWQKYRQAADEFFTAKSNFFKNLDELRAQNLAKKIELCDQVEELIKNENWEKTARQLKKLQQDWKEIGPVPERHSNKVWNRFKAACDTFFKQRRTHYQSLHKEENENLDKKRVLIGEVKGLIEDTQTDVDIAIERIKEIQREWKQIGKVPYKEKDRIWEEFRAEVDTFFNGLTGKREKMRNVRFQSSLNEIKDGDKRTKHIRAKISSLRKRVRSAQEKVDQYGNNMLFIAKGKSGDKLRKQIQDELDKEQEQIDAWKKQIRDLDDLMRNPPSEEAPTPAVEVSAKTPEETKEKPTDSPEAGGKTEEETRSENSETPESPETLSEEKAPTETEPIEAETIEPESTETDAPASEPEESSETEKPASPEEPKE